MKRNHFGNVLLASLFLASTAALAQSRITADVPFAFRAGSADLPAGKYLISEDHIHGMMTIRNMRTNAVVQEPIHQETARGDDRDRMIFHHYGELYFLSEIHQGSDALDVSLPVSSRERKVQSMLVASYPKAKPQGVEIALK
jgi:hypothetical protein